MEDAEDEAEREREFASDWRGRVVLGHYRIEDLLGVGGIGMVFRALDLVSGELVVVKTIRGALLDEPTIAPRFLREARVTMGLQHPAIPRGIAAGMADERRPVLVMEYVAGRTLDAASRGGGLGVPDALRAGARVAEALQAAHAAGVVHRDIKPENVMLVDGAGIPQGVVVLDFGIAFCLDEPRFTATGSLIGTPQYLSPEQARGEAVTPASDLYSLGATLVDLLTGTTLYEGSTLVQIASHQQAPLPDWGRRRPDLPAPVVAFVNALLAKDPSERPESAAVAAEALYALARWCERPDDAEPLPGVYRVLAEPPAPAGGELLAELRSLQLRRHRVMRDAAEAQRRLVHQLVELSTRRAARAPGAPGDADDAAREAALEAAVARLQARCLQDQSDLLTRILDVRKRLAALGG